MPRLFTFQEMEKICGGRWSGEIPKDAYIDFISTDSRKDCRNSIFFAIKGETLDGHEYLAAAAANSASAICISKSRQGMKLPEKIPALIVEDTLKAYQALSNFHRRRLGLKVIALTGSSGKTSTKEILKAILAHAYGAEKIYATEGNTNNHVGVPQNLLNLQKQHEYAIIEMGSNHPGEIEVLSRIAEPDYGIIVSIGSAHIEFFGSADAIATEKSAIFAKMPASGTAVLPAEGPGMGVLAKVAEKFKILSFGSEKADKADLEIRYLGGNMAGSRFELAWKSCGLRKTVNWQLTGKHQAMNAGAAILAANAVGVTPETAVEALNKGVQLPGMRMRVQERDGITWINDAYNANPESMRAGIEWFREATSQEAGKGSRIFVVLGDMLEMGEAGPRAHAEMLEFVSGLLPMAMIVVVGPIMTRASESLGLADVSLRHFPNSDEAAKYVKSKIKYGDVIFLKGSRGMKLERIENIFQP